MGIQTTVLEFIANQNHNNSSRSSSTSLVNNTTKDTQPIHESHSLKQQQHETEERFSDEESLPWEKVTTKQRNNRNQSIEKTKLFVGDLNQSKT